MCFICRLLHPRKEEEEHINRDYTHTAVSYPLSPLDLYYKELEEKGNKYYQVSFPSGKNDNELNYPMPEDFIKKTKCPTCGTEF